MSEENPPESSPERRPTLLPGWKEVYRVLKQDGRIKCGFAEKAEWFSKIMEIPVESDSFRWQMMALKSTIEVQFALYLASETTHEGLIYYIPDGEGHLNQCERLSDRALTDTARSLLFGVKNLNNPDAHLNEMMRSKQDKLNEVNAIRLLDMGRRRNLDNNKIVRGIIDEVRASQIQNSILPPPPPEPPTPPKPSEDVEPPQVPPI